MIRKNAHQRRDRVKAATIFEGIESSMQQDFGYIADMKVREITYKLMRKKWAC
ncbi:hypothetical protein KAU87_00375 [Candidatus Bathyarchaeota archaeon]|nr:hypothetical protein [Candidatus Bathyarchaeota archaeon]